MVFQIQSNSTSNSKCVEFHSNSFKWVNSLSVQFRENEVIVMLMLLCQRSIFFGAHFRIASRNDFVCLSVCLRVTSFSTNDFPDKIGQMKILCNELDQWTNWALWWMNEFHLHSYVLYFISIVHHWAFVCSFDWVESRKMNFIISRNAMQVMMIETWETKSTFIRLFIIFPERNKKEAFV